MKIVIVVPTYNEAANIGVLIEALEKEFLKIQSQDMHILVVDGNSPDKTGDLVLEKAKVYSNVHLILEKKKAGLGAAYAYGFKYAMTELGADALMEMDADFQHDPLDVSKFIKAFENGADYVVGSRFTRGGSIPKEWALYRKLLSIGGSIFSKIVLGVFSVNDFTSGFKLSRVKGFVDKLDLDANLSKGFAYKIDLLYRMYNLGAKIVEVPIAFGLRDRGDSKMEKNNFSDSFKVVIFLRYNRDKHFFKFLSVGVMGLVVDLGIFNIFRLVISSAMASSLSGFFGMLTTFLLNNFWSFKDRSISQSYLAKLLPSGLGIILAGGFYFIASYVPIYVRSEILIKYAEQYLGKNFFVSNGAFGVGIFIGLIWNYLVYSRLIWRKNK